MKEAKTLTISFLAAIFISSCISKKISGTYQTKFPNTNIGFKKTTLILYKDSTFYYTQCYGRCWCTTEYESEGKWIFKDSILVLNSRLQPSDTIKYQSNLQSKYKYFRNHTYIISKRSLIDTTQRQLFLRTLKKVSSSTKY